MASRRPPLGEVTRSVNNYQNPGGPSRPNVHPQRGASSQNKVHKKEKSYDLDVLPDNTRRSKPSPEKAKKEVKVRKPYVWTTGPGRKETIGPWELGMDLGSGATAHVRKARHLYTQQLVAVKIILKKDPEVVKNGSFAVLDKIEGRLPANEVDPHRMPLGIEREVAIMKLIDHPHVLKLHDIWTNRDEIYLFIDYADKGELFDYIATKHRLEEAEAMGFFRQMLSAIGYCHSFNICHRDLKPENILLTSEGIIKIADFGMAALQQTATHRLDTSCGSPHYAAPEVISGGKYAGDKADIWSMGVILYATLSGTLPFDHPGPGIGQLLAMVRKGNYQMSEYFSSFARDLIARLLRKRPEERPTCKDIWNHPQLTNYNYLDNLAKAHKNTLIHKTFERPARVSEIEEPVLRHLRAMYHTFTEAQLVERLMSDRPNDHQRFYALLKQARVKQLENYNSQGLDYSASDYHHLRPLSEVRKLSTRHFFQPSRDGYGGQQVTAFTVIGPGLKDPNDPFTESKARKENPNRQVGAESSSMGAQARPPTNTGIRRSHTRNSLATSVRLSPPGVKPKVGKRGVSFPRQNPSSSSNGAGPSQANVSVDPIVQNGRDMTSELRSEQYIRSKKGKKTIGEMLQPMVPQMPQIRKSKRISRFWEDDVRKVSTSLGRDCEKAFNLVQEPTSSLKVEVTGIESPSKLGSSAGLESFAQDDPAIESSPRLSHNIQQKSGKAWWKDRPLPPPPGRTDSIKNELLEQRRRAEQRRASGNPEAHPGHVDRMISHLDTLMEPTMPPHPAADRRIRSAPVSRKGDTHLASIEETSSMAGSESGSDFASQVLPKHPRAKNQDRTSKNTDKSFQKKGVRIVPASSVKTLSPIKPTPAMNIRNKSAQNGHPAQMAGALRKDAHHKNQKYNERLREAQANEYRRMDLSGIDEYRRMDLPGIDEYDTKDFEENSNGTVKQKKVWFKGSSNDDLDVVPGNTKGLKPQAETIKKKGFGFGTLFKKRAPDPKNKMEIVFDADDSMAAGPMDDNPELAAFNAKQLADRLIEPQQSWFGRLFNFKPTQKHVCCTASKRRARQEVVILFQKWKNHGMTDIVVDKERSIVFARITDNNALDLKPLTFACEILAVVEHGNRNPLSILRLTQEKGAASTLAFLHGRLRSAFLDLDMLLNDDRKEAWMIETLNHLKYA